MMKRNTRKTTWERLVEHDRTREQHALIHARMMTERMTERREARERQERRELIGETIVGVHNLRWIQASNAHRERAHFVRIVRRWQPCVSTKHQHATQARAEEHMQQLQVMDLRLKQPQKSYGLNTYQCADCSAWHVGRSGWLPVERPGRHGFNQQQQQQEQE